MNNKVLRRLLTPKQLEQIEGWLHFEPQKEMFELNAEVERDPGFFTFETFFFERQRFETGQGWYFEVAIDSVTNEPVAWTGGRSE